MNKKLSLLSCMLVLCGVPHVALAAPADRVPVDYSGVQLRQIEERRQSPDHPILWGVPETEYLKFLIFQVV